MPMLTDFERPPRHTGQLIDLDAIHQVPERLSPLPRWVMAQREPVLCQMSILAHPRVTVG
jgi:hypothetical protein